MGSLLVVHNADSILKINPDKAQGFICVTGDYTQVGRMGSKYPVHCTIALVL